MKHIHALDSSAALVLLGLAFGLLVVGLATLVLAGKWGSKVG